VRAKNVERKIVAKKLRKIFFYIHTNIVTKKWGKTRETIFPETHQSCQQKMLGKKSSEKSAKKRFLYSHEYGDQKWGVNARNHFPRNSPIERAKNVGKKIVAKYCEKTFFIFTRIS